MRIRPIPHAEAVQAAERFWKKVKTNPETGCREWTGGVCKNGYGKFFLNGAMVSVHRFAVTVTSGEIGEGLYVCHKCDNPRCVNPEHLFLGTAKQNCQDMLSKGRRAHWKAKLTLDDVMEIRTLHESGESATSLAEQFNISAGHASQIIRGKVWKDPSKYATNTAPQANAS